MLELFFSQITIWHWLILAVLLLVVELTTGSGFVLWVAIGSLLVSLVMFVHPGLTWEWQLLLFSVFSLSACLLWWRFLKTRTEKSDQPLLNQRTAQYVGRTFTLSQAIHNGRGKIKIGDTHWLVEGDDLPEGAKVIVKEANGVILKVEAAENSNEQS